MSCCFEQSLAAHGSLAANTVKYENQTPIHAGNVIFFQSTNECVTMHKSLNAPCIQIYTCNNAEKKLHECAETHMFAYVLLLTW